MIDIYLLHCHPPTPPDIAKTIIIPTYRFSRVAIFSLNDTTVFAVFVRLAPPPPPFVEEEDVAETADGLEEVSFLERPNQFMVLLLFHNKIIRMVCCSIFLKKLDLLGERSLIKQWWCGVAGGWFFNWPCD